MDLEGYYPQSTISHCITSNETQITLHFFSGSNICNARDKSRFILGNILDWNVCVNSISFLNVLLFWFPADQGLKKVDFITLLKLVKISYDSE